MEYEYVAGNHELNIHFLPKNKLQILLKVFCKLCVVGSVTPERSATEIALIEFECDIFYYHYLLWFVPPEIHRILSKKVL